MTDEEYLKYEELAIIGYDAYGAEAGWLTWDNKQMPTWNGIGDVVRNRWIMAVKAIFESCQPRG